MSIQKSKLQLARRLSQLVFFILLIAGFYMNIRMVIIILLPATLFFGNFFCGWICPFGTIQELMSNIGSIFFKKKIKMPKSLQKYLQYSRYLLFAILILGILDFILIPLNGYTSFMGIFSEEGISALSIISLVLMITYLLASMVFERVFCNYICTESAKYGILSMTRIFSIKRNEETCVNCKKCDHVCPMNITISEYNHVRNGQCINCFKCIDTCPIEGTLKYTRVKLPIINRKKE